VKNPLTRKPYLTRKEILQAGDLEIEDVEVPEWGGVVRVRGLTGEERDALEMAMITRKGKSIEIQGSNFRARLVAMSVVDERGERIFSDSDVAALGNKSGHALQRVFEVAQRLSGFSEADVEELGKNWSIGPGGASPSA
jgi:hypothetical protein